MCCVPDHCVERGCGGSIVNIGSMYGQVASYPDAYTHTNPTGDASPISYHCLKGGTIHMTRHMAAYWAADGIRVNCLSPGAFPSPKVQSVVHSTFGVFYLVDVDARAAQHS